MMMNDRRKTKNREFKRRQRKGRKGNKKTKTRAYAHIKDGTYREERKKQKKTKRKTETRRGQSETKEN